MPPSDQVPSYRPETETSSNRASASVSPSYRRALWVVVALSVGFGVVEIVGGFLSGSQALKADALDFLGDGLITLLGIIIAGLFLQSSRSIVRDALGDLREEQSLPANACR